MLIKLDEFRIIAILKAGLPSLTAPNFANTKPIDFEDQARGGDAQRNVCPAVVPSRRQSRAWSIRRARTFGCARYPVVLRK